MYGSKELNLRLTLSCMAESVRAERYKLKQGILLSILRHHLHGQISVHQISPLWFHMEKVVH